jgi:hypothetical protein
MTPDYEKSVRTAALDAVERPLASVVKNPESLFVERTRPVSTPFGMGQKRDSRHGPRGQRGSARCVLAYKSLGSLLVLR